MTARRITVDGCAVDVLDLPGSEPAVVLLHEGLGSVGLWRGFPAAVQERSDRRVIAFSRHGHGRSMPPPRPRTPGFMHEEARIVLPALLTAMEAERPVLLGHSDGASIALIHAAEQQVAGVIAMAPHVFVEDICIEAIEQTRETFLTGGLRQRMARHHDDPDVTFGGWATVWLDPAFRAWNLTSLLDGITSPVLLIQGRDDEYGTLAQLDAIERSVTAPVERLVVAGGHSPHLSAPSEVLRTIIEFLQRVPARAA